MIRPLTPALHRLALVTSLSGLFVLASLVCQGLGISLMKSFYQTIGRRVEWLIDSHEVEILDQHLAGVADKRLLEA